MMRTVLVLMSLATLALSLTIPPDSITSTEAATSTKTLWETLRERGFNRFVDLAIKSGVFETVTEQGKYTLFVPTDAAFDKFRREFPVEVIDDKTLLSYHIVPTERYTKDFLNEELIATTHTPTVDLRFNTYTTFDGQTPFFTVNGVNLTQTNFGATNGVYHVLDEVLYPIPTGNIMETLKTTTKYNVKPFYQSLVDQGLETELTKTTPFTIFVPITSTTPTTGTAQPIDISKYIFPGTYYTNGFSFNKPILDKTGRSLKIENTTTGEPKINGSTIIGRNFPATNGVIHFLENDYMY